MHLYVIRHGQSLVNLPDFDWSKGPVDAGLTPLGQQQAARAAAWLAEHVTAAALYSSTMRRAVETADAISQAVGLPVIREDRLREIGNCWPDALPIDVDKDPPQWSEHWASEQPFNPIAPDGETWGDFVTRVGRALMAITRQHTGGDEQVLIVAHGGVMNAMVDIVFNVGHYRTADIWIHNTGIMYLEYRPPGHRQELWRIHTLNMTCHLLQQDGTLLG